MRAMTSHAGVLVATAASCLLLGGCLVSGSSTTYESGRRISDSTRSQIEIGTTTGDWLVATLGEPTSRKDLENAPGVEIWRYDYIERRESDSAVFLLFAGSSSKSTSSTTYFELTDGVVTRSWSE